VFSLLIVYGWRGSSDLEHEAERLLSGNVGTLFKSLTSSLQSI
jgi:hypothetical protein